MWKTRLVLRAGALRLSPARMKNVNVAPAPFWNILVFCKQRAGTGCNGVNTTNLKIEKEQLVLPVHAWVCVCVCVYSWNEYPPVFFKYTSYLAINRMIDGEHLKKKYVGDWFADDHDILSSYSGKTRRRTCIPKKVYSLKFIYNR